MSAIAGTFALLSVNSARQSEYPTKQQHFSFLKNSHRGARETQKQHAAPMEIDCGIMVCL